MYNDLNFGFCSHSKTLNWCTISTFMVLLLSCLDLDSGGLWTVSVTMKCHRLACVFTTSHCTMKYKPQLGCMCQISFWLTQCFCFAASIFIGIGYKNACNDDTFIAVCSMSVSACDFKIPVQDRKPYSFSSHTWHLIKQDIQWNYCPHVMIGWEKACYREATCFSTWPLSLPLLLHLHNLFKCFTMTDRKHSSYPNRWRGRDVE